MRTNGSIQFIIYLRLYTCNCSISKKSLVKMRDVNKAENKIIYISCFPRLPFYSSENKTCPYI